MFLEIFKLMEIRIMLLKREAKRKPSNVLKR